MSRADREHLQLLRRMRRLLLRSQHGQVLFLWGDDPRSLNWLASELDRSLRAHSLRLRRCGLGQDALPQPTLALPLLLTPEPGAQLFAVWVDLGQTAAADAARDHLLARLNERRAALLAPARPVLLVGHGAGEAAASAVAPDLWSVRTASFTVPPWPAEPPAAAAAAEPGPVAPGHRLALVALWEQALGEASAEGSIINTSLAFEALAQALDAGQVTVAARVLQQLRPFVAEPGPQPHETALRQAYLLATWEGEIALSQGQALAAAAPAVRAEAWAQALMQLTGESPQALRDWSVSLNKLGDVKQALGDLAGARGHYEQGLAVSERLVQLTGESPQALRDWSVSLDKLGDVQQALGDLAGAHGHYEHSLALRERLAQLTGESPQALRDWSVSLNKLGNVQQALGDLAGARSHHEQGLAVSERLVHLTGESPKALRDWSVSLEKVGDMQQALGDLAGARGHHEQGLALRERLVQLTGESPQALHDAAISRLRLGELDQAQGLLTAADHQFRHGQACIQAALRQSPLNKAMQDLAAHVEQRLEPPPT